MKTEESDAEKAEEAFFFAWDESAWSVLLMSPPFVRGEVRRDGRDGLAFFLCPTFNKPYSTSIKHSFQNGRDIKT